MAKKINLLIQDFCCCAKLLYKEFNVLKNGYYFYEKGEINANFDAVLKFDSDSTHGMMLICDLYDIPIIGIRRYTKTEQNMILKKAGMMCPDTYDNKLYEGKDLETLHTLLSDLEGDTDIILKPLLGAKGMGQVKMKKNELHAKIYELWKPNSEETKKAKKENDNNNNDSSYLSKQIRNGNYCVQIFDRKIEEEYRILYFFGNDPIIMKRIKGDNTWQSNNGAKPDNNSKYIKDSITDLFGKKNEEKLAELFHGLDTPFLSIDVYKNRDGEMGVMEFQMEFGYENCPVGLLYKNINSSVSKMIAEKQKKH